MALSSSNQTCTSAASSSILAITALAFVGGAAAASAMRSSSLFKYKPDKIWKFRPQGGTWGAVNRPTAGPRSTATLPRGQHNIQLYSLGTPNGMKVTCLLEELCLQYGIEYDAWRIGIGSKELQQFSTGFVEANPNSKIPALLLFQNGQDDEEPTRIFESAAIMMCLCEMYDTDGIFLPPVGDPKRAECLSWLFWVQGSAPFLGGGFGHFYHYAPIKMKYAIDRYSMETKRQLDVLERHLSGYADSQLGEKQSTYSGGPYLCGDQPTVADMSCYPWYGRLVQGEMYGSSGEFLRTREEYPNVLEWAERMEARKGVKRGCMVNRSTGDKILRERHSSADFDGLE